MSEGATPPALPHEQLFIGRDDLMGRRRRPQISKDDLPAGWRDTEPHPWRRYFARRLDTVISGVIAEVALIWGSAAIDPEVGGRIVSILTGANLIFQTMIIVALAVIPNAVIIGLSGCSIGKWIFGIRVLKPNGKPIGLFRGLEREIRVLVMGLGLGIPGISLITMIGSMMGLGEKGSTAWDRDMKLVVAQRGNHFGQVALGVFGVALYVAILAGLALLKMRQGP